jgi:anaerobic selenocysteine-containing dehydrogenase
VRATIARVVSGFAPYEERLTGGGFGLPIPPRERVFGEPGRRARFTVQEPTALAVAPDQLVLTSIRSHDQFNTAVFGLGDRYRGVAHERNVLFMHSLDMDDRGIAADSVVEVVSTSLGRELVSHPLHALPYDLPRGAVAAYFPEANCVIPADVVDPESGTPAYKSVVVTVRPVARRSSHF